MYFLCYYCLDMLRKILVSRDSYKTLRLGLGLSPTYTEEPVMNCTVTNECKISDAK